MSKFRRLQQPIRDVSLKDKYPESNLCIDCGFDTAPGNLGRVADSVASASPSAWAGAAGRQFRCVLDDFPGSFAL